MNWVWSNYVVSIDNDTWLRYTEDDFDVFVDGLGCAVVFVDAIKVIMEFESQEVAIQEMEKAFS